MDKRGEYQEFPSNIFCLTVPKNFVGEALSASQISSNENVWIRGGEYQEFPSKDIVSLNRNNSLENTLVFQANSFIENFHAKEGGTSRFCQNYCLAGPKRKVLYRNPSVFRKTSGIENHLWIRGGISRLSFGVFMSHTAENYRSGILRLLRKFLVSERFMDENGGIMFFRRKCLVS